MKTVPAQLKRIPKLPALIINLIATLSTISLAYVMIINHIPVTGWYRDTTFIVNSSWLWQHISNSFKHVVTRYNLWDILASPDRIWLYFIRYFDQYDLIYPLGLRLIIFILLLFICITGAHFYCTRHLERKDKLIHLKGRKLLKGRPALKQLRAHSKRLIKQYGKGLKIAPKAHISLETETKHFLGVGASGSGKTQVFKYFLSQLIHANDKIVLHDTKGDMTETLPSEDFILLAPHDKRSWVWDIAKDCKSLADAQELAARFIPTGTDETWAQGARQIFIGVLRHLQQHKAERWTWKDIQEIIFLDPQELLDLLSRIYPEGARYIVMDTDTGAANRTSYSFLVSLWAHTGKIISPLAEAWSACDDEHKISLREWLNTYDDQNRILIFQRSAEYQDLSSVWIGAAINFMANYIAGPSFPDSTDRSIWMFLDEFAQLGKLKGFAQFLEVGRSRGIRCVIGLQDLEQLADIYGKEAQKTWLNSIETKLLFRMNAGPSARFIAEDLIGQREVTWDETSITYSNSDTGAKGSANSRSVNKQSRTMTMPVLLPNYLEDELGAKLKGGEIKIHALLLGYGGLYHLEWHLTYWPKYRLASDPADWTQA